LFWEFYDIWIPAGAGSVVGSIVGAGPIGKQN